MYICCLPFEGKRRHTDYVDFGAQSLSALSPNCLHLRNIVTSASPKLATSDAATSYWMRFPLINLCALLGVPFVPPIHIPGAGLAPLQGPALWKIFLPATGSFFVFVVTDLSGLIPFPAPSGGRFPGLFLIPFSIPVTAEFNPHRASISIQFNCNKNILYLSSSAFYAACSCGRLISPNNFSASYATPVVRIL